jgi:hypothetical protein
MRTAILVLVLFTAAACSADGEVVTGSGDRVTLGYELEAFTQVSVSDAFAVQILADSTGNQSVEVEIDDNLLDRVDIRVDGERLLVGFKDSIRVRVGDRPIVEITMSHLDWLEVSGASEVVANGVTAEDFEVEGSGASTIILDGEINNLVGELSGASTLTVGGIDAANVTLGVSGASKAFLSGTVDRLVLDASGASRVQADDLSALIGDLEASGASTIRALLNESGSADASGASTIVVAGDATLDTTTSGSSSIQRD